MQPQARRFSIFLSGLQYNITSRWNSVSNAWIMDIYDVNEIPVLLNRPLVTGADLLAQFAYLGISGQMIVQSDNDPNAVPTYGDLGSTGHLYYVVPS